MYEYSILVTLKIFHGIFAPTIERHEFVFCAESERDARYLASSNVRSRGWSYDEKFSQIISSCKVYVPETSILFGPVPKESVTVVKFESEPLKSCRDVAIEEVEREVA